MTGARLRLSPSLWAALVAVPLAVLHGFSATPGAAEYRVTTATHGAAALFIVGPLMAAAAAWEAHRHHRIRRLVAVSARRPWRVRAPGVLGPLLGGIVALGSALAAAAAAAGQAPTVAPVVVSVAMLAGLVLLGYGLGHLAPPVFVVPAVLAGGYAWMVMPIAVEPLWVRHLNGVSFACCQIDSVFAPQVVVATLVVAGALAAAGVALTALATRPLAGALLAVACVAAGMVVAVPQVRGLGPDPTRPRDLAALTCETGPPQVCVWPEHAAFLPMLSRAAVEVAGAMTAAGLAPPAGGFTEATTGRRGQATFGVSPRTRAEQYPSVLVTSAAAVQPDLTCTFAGGDARYETALVLGALISVPATQVGDPQLADAAARIADQLRRGARTARADELSCRMA